VDHQAWQCHHGDRHEGGSTDTKTRSNWTCQSVTVTGKLKSGSGLSGSGAGSVSAVTFNTCTNPLGKTPPNQPRVTFKITATARSR